MNISQQYDDGNYAEVIKYLADKSNTDKELEMLGYAYQKTGAWEKGMNVWNHLILKYPTNAYYYSERGVCKFNLRFKHAIQDFNKAVELQPETSYFYSCRAFIKDKTGDTEGAVEDYNKAHKLDPEDALLLNNLGLAEQKLGYTQKARERFKNSDDLLGIKTIDSRSEPESTPPKGNLWQEIKKMISSKEGFMQFLKELGISKNK